MTAATAVGASLSRGKGQTPPLPRPDSARLSSGEGLGGGEGEPTSHPCLAAPTSGRGNNQPLLVCCLVSRCTQDNLVCGLVC